MALIHRYPHLVGFVHNSALIVFATVCLVGGLSLIRHGLSPFTELRERLAAVRDGRDRRVDGRYPSEVQPLVDDLNALLEHREQTVQRAIAKAGDLAHALKTPLAVLAHEAEAADAAGHGELAAIMSLQVERMRRQMDYHLAHARAAASGATPGARCSVKESAEGLSRTLLRLHAGRGVAVDVRVAAEHSAAHDGDVVITVDDDGPGLDPSMRDVVLQRGVRADEAAPGSGLGLAIVRDLAELYGGSISLSRSPDGGVRARLQLPAC
jgi:signal transduction histidine kinase